MKLHHTVFLVTCLGMIALPACAQLNDDDDGSVRSYFSGNITVNAEIDTTKNYSGFELLVAMDVDGEPDTLGYAETDRAGDFSMEVNAPQRGRYALIVSRRGGILKTGVIAVAEGDSATMKAEFPIPENRPFRIRSMENGAWVAFENATAQHSRDLLTLVQSGDYTEEEMLTLVYRTTAILWSMQITFPGTVATELAAAEAVTMVAEWDPALALERAEEIDPTNFNYLEVVRASRAAVAHLSGQEAAIALLEKHVEGALTDADRAALEIEIIVARHDSMQYDQALELAKAFVEKYQETDYEDWGKRVIYELENLIPGKEAPKFAIRDIEGDSLKLVDLRGKYVLLEFYHPQDDGYEREMEGRLSLFNRRLDLEIVSVSMDPDPLITEAFMDSRFLPGRHAIHPPGLGPLYNVNVVTTRFLINPDGKIVAKYVGNAMAAIHSDLLGDEWPEDPDS